jgi:ABC-2 type transport system ATP-binding protein
MGAEAGRPRTLGPSPGAVLESVMSTCSPAKCWAIECYDVVKVYPGNPAVEALRGVSLQVQEGECFGLLGPNGAGKTTTMEILEGLLEPTAGRVRVLGRSWHEGGRELRRRIGVTLQETRLSERLTCRETLRLFRSFYGKGPQPEELLELLELSEKADTLLRALSSGQRQRLAVACALIGDPELIFLDEPTTGLDPQSRRQVWQILERLRRDGRTIVLSTHYMEEAERLCDRVAIIDRGKIIALDTPRTLIASLGGDHLVELSLEQDGELSLAELERLPGVRQAQRHRDAVRLAVADPRNALEAILEYARTRQLTVATLQARHASLEDVFLNLTGRRLKDEG